MSTPGPTYEQRVRRWSSTERWRAEADALLDLMALAPGADVLDVGTGAGALQPLAAARGLTLFGVDRWNGWNAFAPGPRTARADAARLPFRSAAFERIGRPSGLSASERDR